MIAFLKGVVQRVEFDGAIIDVGGVGYEVSMSTKTSSQLSKQSSVELEIYTHIREDAFKLYGFSTQLEKKLFLAFIGISGVGPKMALSVLSAVSSLELLVEMIETEDVKAICRLPRVGKKIAQTVILDLKGKLPAVGIGKSEEIKMRQWLSNALTNLGFRPKEIQMALEQVPLDKDQSLALKKALSYLQPNREMTIDGA